MDLGRKGYDKDLPFRDHTEIHPHSTFALLEFPFMSHLFPHSMSMKITKCKLLEKIIFNLEGKKVLLVRHGGAHL